MQIVILSVYCRNCLSKIGLRLINYNCQAALCVICLFTAESRIQMLPNKQHVTHAFGFEAVPSCTRRGGTAYVCYFGPRGHNIGRIVCAASCPSLLHWGTGCGKCEKVKTVTRSLQVASVVEFYSLLFGRGDFHLTAEGTWCNTFLLTFGRDKSIIEGPLIILFWTSGEICPGFPHQDRPFACVLSTNVEV